MDLIALGIIMSTVKRRNFEQIWDELRRDGKLPGLIASSAQDYENSLSRRFRAPMTEKARDRTLELYYRYLKETYNLPDDVAQLILRDAGFPRDVKELTKLTGTFLIMVYRITEPKSRATTGNRIQYSTLDKYRGHLLFWIDYIFVNRQEPIPDRALLSISMGRAMREAYLMYRDLNAPLPQEPVYLGLPEIRQLIDLDLMTTGCIELAEQHQLAWCIAYITALRPGSLGPSEGRTEPLRLKDLEFYTVNNEPGKFHCKLTIRVLKTNRDNDPEFHLKRPYKILVFHINCPQKASNLGLSIPHRALGILIRRKRLVGINTIEDLMKSDLQNIRIKPAYLEDPLFYAGGPRGLSLDFDNPMTSAGLSTYLSRAGKKLGLSKPIGYRAIRRRAATELTLKVGPDQARTIMGHAIESRTLERHYLNLSPYQDLSAIGLHENVPEGEAAAADVIQARALPQLTPERLKKIRGSALNSLTDCMILDDPNFDNNMTTAAEYQAYRARIRALAYKVLLEREHEEQKSAMTQADATAKAIRGTAEASRFAQEVLGRARAALRMPVPVSTADPDPDPFYNFDEAFLEDDEDEPEPDAEDFDVDDHEVTISGDAWVDDAVANDDDDEVDYATAAAASMHIVMDNVLNEEIPWKDQPEKRCILCLSDDTVDDDTKSKEYIGIGPLRKHMHGNFHSGVAQYRRQVTNAFNEKPSLGISLSVLHYCLQGGASWLR